MKDLFLVFAYKEFTVRVFTLASDTVEVSVYNDNFVETVKFNVYHGAELNNIVKYLCDYNNIKTVFETVIPDTYNKFINNNFVQWGREN